jgi:hypothetical protein
VVATRFKQSTSKEDKVSRGLRNGSIANHCEVLVLPAVCHCRMEIPHGSIIQDFNSGNIPIDYLPITY